MTSEDSPPGASRKNRHTAKRDRSWSLLMVGDHGQIIPFRRVKGIAIALTTLATLAILAAVGLGFWGGWLRVQNAGLQTELKALRQSIQHLKDEKDLLMAKVVILETKNQKDAPVATSVKEGQGESSTTPSVDTKTPQKNLASSEKLVKPTPAAPKQAPKSAPVSKKPSAATIPKVPAAAATKVAVSAFMADHRTSNNALSARFQIKNTGPRGQRVSGRCVLVLKNAVKSDMEWVSVPHVSLISGRPNGKQGRAFRIANFMTLKMRTERVPDNFAFDTGTLYVYDDAAKLLLEKEVPVQLSYRKPPPKRLPKPEATTTQNPVKPTPTQTERAVKTPSSEPPSEVPPGGTGPIENIKPAEAATTPKPEPHLTPDVSATPTPGSGLPQTAPPPAEITEPRTQVPAGTDDDPSLMTGSEATPPTTPPEPTLEDAR